MFNGELGSASKNALEFLSEYWDAKITCEELKSSNYFSKSLPDAVRKMKAESLCLCLFVCVCVCVFVFVFVCLCLCVCVCV